MQEDMYHFTKFSAREWYNLATLQSQIHSRISVTTVTTNAGVAFTSRASLARACPELGNGIVSVSCYPIPARQTTFASEGGRRSGGGVDG